MTTTQKRLTAFGVTLTLIAFIGLASAIYQFNRANGYREVINHTYSRSLSELSESVENIGFSLDKSLLISSPGQLVRLSNEINRHSNSAKANLGQLPLSDTQMDNTEKFLSQAGDFVNALAVKVSMGEKITEEDYKSLNNLSKYCDKLSKSFKKIQSSYMDGKLSVERLKNQAYKENSKFLNDMISAGEEDFVNYPALVYDGPFSSHIDTVEYSVIQGLPEISSKEAKDILRKFIGNDKYIIKANGEKEGKLPSYIFEVYSDNSKAKNYLTAEITKQGGKLSWFLNNYNPKSSKISVSQAIENAKNFLNIHGYYNMVQSYYDCSENVATVNFAYEQNGIIMYPDLIKVKIAMDTGECIGLEASGFLMNNKDRLAYKANITEEQAKESVSALAKIESVRLAVIPTDYMSEILCYELKGRIDNRNYLVYVNANTGVQEKILILLESENGILTI